ncbi:MAG TPA: OmpA family protein [Alphaproteobacteria bacterium]|nr:OmpA family protein [Alphaproteobacteria bacterium]
MTARKILLLATLAVLACPTLAHAANDRQVWRDTDGQIVHNTFGACVRSRWLIGEDPCAPEVARIEWLHHTYIARAGRTVYFAFNRADLSPEARQRLKTLEGKVMAAADIRGVRIVGYADRLGTASYNLVLSKKRAETVRRYMIRRGLAKPSVTRTRWLGKSVSITDCPAAMPRSQLIDCLQPDRRVTVEIVYRDVPGPAASER